MSEWFFMVGEPLAESEHGQVRDYLRGLGFDDGMPVERVRDWDGARRAIDNPAWDRRWWDAEQVERGRLFAGANAAHGEIGVLRSLSRVVAVSAEAAHGAAAIEAARRGCSDAALIRAAAGAASEALYLAELARLAGESAAHPFAAKQALFAGGHWPLGIVNGRYHVF